VDCTIQALATWTAFSRHQAADRDTYVQAQMLMSLKVAQLRDPGEDASL
jgi:hypothetical protein